MGSPAHAAILSQYDSSDNDTGDEGANNDGITDKATDDVILTDGLSDKEHGDGGTGAQAEGAAYVGPYEEAEVTIKSTVANKATDGENCEDSYSAKGGHGRGHELRHGMAGLKAAMAVPRSTAVRLAEHAQANQATTEEMATEHEAVCGSIVDD